MSASIQFYEEFDNSLNASGTTPHGWSYMTGDGDAKMDFIQKDGFASILVDATGDKHNIWWAVIRRQILELNIPKLMEPGNELRVTARIRSSHAPRRVNLHFNHQRTTDFHSHLMEYDIPESDKWHTISMTTQGFEVQPGDSVAAQLALMDWGRERYTVDIDTFTVEIVPADSVINDLGNPIPYHPAVPDPQQFQYHLKTSQDAVVDGKTTTLLWDLAELRKKDIAGTGLLELTFTSVQRSPSLPQELGLLRIVEVMEDGTLNDQMVIDSELPQCGKGRALFTLNPQVLQRMIQGRTKGLALYPLGDFQATFQTNNEPDPPRLHIGFIHD